jgi:hypothetical protein
MGPIGSRATLTFLAPPYLSWVRWMPVSGANPLLGRRSILLTAAIIAAVLCCQSGCVATKYKMAKKNSPPIQLLNIAFPASPPLQPTLSTLISFGGPGSWKREALWDEYVVTVENHGEQPLRIDSAALADAAGIQYAPGSDPWALEKQSKKLEKQYRDHGQAFIRAAGPAVLITGAGAVAAAATAGGGWELVSPALGGAAVATVFVLPVYYLTVVGINHYHKKAVMTEFKRRRLPLPVTLAPGESRTGSLFFPMVRSPGSLALQWSGETSSDTAVLPLDFLKGLHVPAAPAGPTQ